jgi:hypothetical protein
MVAGVAVERSTGAGELASLGGHGVVDLDEKSASAGTSLGLRMRELALPLNDSEAFGGSPQPRHEHAEVLDSSDVGSLSDSGRRVADRVFSLVRECLKGQPREIDCREPADFVRRSGVKIDHRAPPIRT